LSAKAIEKCKICFLVYARIRELLGLFARWIAAQTKLPSLALPGFVTASDALAFGHPASRTPGDLLCASTAQGTWPGDGEHARLEINPVSESTKENSLGLKYVDGDLRPRSSSSDCLSSEPANSANSQISWPHPLGSRWHGSPTGHTACRSRWSGVSSPSTSVPRLVISSKCRLSGTPAALPICTADAFAPPRPTGLPRHPNLGKASCKLKKFLTRPLLRLICAWAHKIVRR
jgi:hypothetical protein